MPFPCMTRELRGRSDPRRGAAELAPSNQNQSAAPRTSRRSHQPPLLLLLFPIQLITQGNKYLGSTFLNPTTTTILHSCTIHHRSFGIPALTHTSSFNSLKLTLTPSIMKRIAPLQYAPFFTGNCRPHTSSALN